MNEYGRNIIIIMSQDTQLDINGFTDVRSVDIAKNIRVIKI